jgi:hypothetical protein
MGGIMAARTCLLCGKPLSRIWAGTGEDFCSREHRNQYRLRRGMDRLLEANKVANVMRRRETPRQLPAASLRSAGPSSPRGYFDSQRPRENQVSAFTPPPLPAALMAGLEASSDFLAPSRILGRERPRKRSNAEPAVFRVQPPLTPAVAMRSPAHVAQAPASALSHAAADEETERRAMSSRWRSGVRPIAALRKRETPALATNPLESARPAHQVIEPLQGRALRVSMAAGFRVPEWKLRGVSLARPEITGMSWPDILPLDAKVAGSVPMASQLEVALTTPPMTIPPAPSADFERRFRWPGVIKIVVKNLDSTREQWSAFVPFGSPDESLAKERR